MLADVSFYNLVLFVHIAAVVVAFGVTFAYPILYPLAAKGEGRELPFLHHAQHTIGQRLMAPAGGVALLAGIYLAAKTHQFSEPYVGVGLVILVGLLAAGGAFFGPQETKARVLAERDVTAGTGLSAEYRAVAARIANVGMAGSFLVLVAIFFMVTKLGS